MYWVSHKKVHAFGGLWNKKYRAISKNKMLIFHSRADLDEKILFGKITHHVEPEIRQENAGKRHVRKNKKSTLYSGS